MAEQWLLPDGSAWLLEDGTFWLDEAGASTPPVVVPETPTGPPLPVWSLDLCRGWVKIAEAEAYTFQAVERFNRPGEWSLEVSPQAISPWSDTGNIVDGFPVLYGPADVDSVVLWRDDDIAFAGMVEKVSDGVGAFDSEQTGDTHKLRWSGPDLWGVLMYALAFPDPTVEATNADATPWAVAYDTRTGVASSVLAGYIHDNLSADALLVERRWPNLAVDDKVVGPNATFSARLQSLAELAQRLATDGQFRTRVMLQEDRSIVVLLDAPADLSTSVVISDQGDLSNVKLRRVPNAADWVLAGGQGEGTARTFGISSKVAPSGQRRREVYTEQSSLTTTGELLLAASSTLRFGAPTWSIDAQVTDNLARALRYGRDLNLGDLITIEVDGIRYQVPIDSAVFEITPTRQVVRPQLGTGTPDELRGLIRDVANLAARLDRQIA